MTRELAYISDVAVRSCFVSLTEAWRTPVKKMCCHLQQMVLRVGLILTSIHLLYRCSS